MWPHWVDWAVKPQHKQTVYRMNFNHFILEFLQRTLLSLNLDTSIIANRDISQKSRTEKQTEKILMRWLIIHCLRICFSLPGRRSWTFCFSTENTTLARTAWWCYMQVTTCYVMYGHIIHYYMIVCVEVLRPSQPNGVMLSAVSFFYVFWRNKYEYMMREIGRKYLFGSHVLTNRSHITNVGLFRFSV